MPAAPLLLRKQIRQYHPSRFHIYALIYDICLLFLTDFTLYKRLLVHPSPGNWLKCVPFYGWVVLHCVYVPQLLYPSVDGHPGCFQDLAVVNSAAMNTGVLVSFSVLVSLGYMPRNGLTGSHGGFILSFLRSLCTDFHSGCISLH